MNDQRMSASVRLRQGTGADADDVAELYLQARRHSVPQVPPVVHGDDDVRRWMRDLLGEHEVWLANAADGRAPLGLMVLEGDWLGQLYVDPAWTGRGIGTRLVALAKQRRPGGLQLWTFESNLGAQRFYERHGFTVEERTDGSGNEEGAPDRRYRWRPASGQ